MTTKTDCGQNYYKSVALKINDKGNLAISFRTDPAFANGLNMPGIFTPTIDLDGTLSISFRADPGMNYGLNVPGTFSGTLINRELIGKSSAELVTKWNAALRPADQVAGTG